MYLLINTSNVIIDKTDNLNYIHKNKTNGCLYIGPKEDAIGVMGSNGKIYKLFNSLLTSVTYNIVSEVVESSAHPIDYEPGKYKYVDMSFVRNTDVVVPKSITELTEDSNTAYDNISDIELAMEDTYESSYTSIAELELAIEELYEMILGGK